MELAAAQLEKSCARAFQGDQEGWAKTQKCRVSSIQRDKKDGTQDGHIEQGLEYR